MKRGGDADVRFAILGGDRRMAHLCGLLLRDGHKVSSFALEKAELPKEIPKAGCLQSAVYGTDCVVLPTPAENGGLLNTPLSSELLSMKELIAALWKGQILCAGRLSDRSTLSAVKAGLHVKDIMQRPDFVYGNAALTAEGALEKLMANSEKSLWDSDVLITGFGRIGKIVSLRLLALGARPVVVARKAGDRAFAEALGIRALEYSALEGEIGDFDFIINTVPDRVITEAMLCCCESGTVILELASPPGGFDKNLAENIGLCVLSAPGLPGKSSPYTGAVLMKKAIYEAIKEQEE